MMFGHYGKRGQIILVTGPQRSGTTICARMIQHDTGFEYLDEELWQVWDGQKARDLAESRQPCVLQAPGLLKDATLFNDPNCLVVMMFRDIPEIVMSQKRVGWNVWAEKELSYYDTEHKEFHRSPALWVAGVKYAYWKLYVRPQLRQWEEVHYDQLVAHPMWIPKEKRKDFNARQYRAR